MSSFADNECYANDVKNVDEIASMDFSEDASVGGKFYVDDTFGLA